MGTSNARHRPGYTPFDAVTLSARPEQHIAIVNPRSFLVLFSQSDTPEELAWDAGRQVPDNWLQVWARENEAWMVDLRVTMDRTLTAELTDTLKVTFLVDVHAA